MEDDHLHLQDPLISLPVSSGSVFVIDPTITEQRSGCYDRDIDHNLSSSGPDITFRLCLISLVALVSLWANHEASRGFPIAIINEASGTVSGRRFHVFYVSNDEATRSIIKTSEIVKSFLYPFEIAPKKQVDGITLKLAVRNLTDEVVVDSNSANEFVLNISPSVVESTTFQRDILRAIQNGVIQVWLYNGNGKTPVHVINGIAEYVTTNLLQEQVKLSRLPAPEGSATGCWKAEDRRAVAELLNYGERQRPGFIAKLNQAMKDEWHVDMLDNALGFPVEELCTSSAPSMYNVSSLAYNI